MNIRKIYVIAAVHGDEPFGLKILGSLQELGRPEIITRVGHPEAVAKRKEFLEANLNRSFGPNNPDSKEARLAKYILADIKREKPDLVIDLHTCECKVGKSAIITNKEPALIIISKKLGMDYVFIGVPQLSKVSLVGQNPTKTITLEFGLGQRSDQLAKNLANKIAGLLDEQTKVLPLPKIPVYSLSRLIGREEAAGQNLINYEFNKKLGGYPYLVGSNTYTEYVGFLAEKLSHH